MTEREQQIEVLSRAIDEFVNLRTTLAAGAMPTGDALTSGIYRAKRAFCLCFDLRRAITKEEL